MSGLGNCQPVIVLPGGSSPRPPFSRFARRAVIGKAPSLFYIFPLVSLRSAFRLSVLSCSTDDSAPSEARKRGSGGGSPRKYDDLLQVRRNEGSSDPISRLSELIWTSLEGLGWRLFIIWSIVPNQRKKKNFTSRHCHLY
jgi:hypothetical protein